MKSKGTKRKVSTLTVVWTWCIYLHMVLTLKVEDKDEPKGGKKSKAKK